MKQKDRILGIKTGTFGDIFSKKIIKAESDLVYTFEVNFDDSTKTKFNLILIVNNQKLMVFNGFQGNVTTRLDWAGDLNGDGYLDFMIDYGSSKFGENTFLISNFKDGVLKYLSYGHFVNEGC